MGDCQKCGSPIQKKAHESVARYNNKKYCSTICCRQYMKDHKLGWFSANKTLISKIPRKRWDDFTREPYIYENNEDSEF